jgi:hypothetical protein
VDGRLQDHEQWLTPTAICRFDANNNHYPRDGTRAQSTEKIG